MNALADIDLRAAVAAAVIDTFRTLLAMDVRPMEEAPPPVGGARRMVATLPFAGEAAGILNVQFSFDFGRRMASARQGAETEAPESKTAVRDLAAEVARSVGGSFASALNGAGYACMLSAPSVACGTDFGVRSPNTERFERCGFQADGHAFIVEVALRGREGSHSSRDLDSPDGADRVPNGNLREIDASDYGSRLAEAVVAIFGTLFAFKLERVEPPPAADPGGMRFSASVGIAGDAAGIVRLDVGEALARRMAAARPGPDKVEGLGGVEAMLGKAAEMTAGSLISALTDAGLYGALSTPAFTSGSDFSVETLDLDHCERLEFRCDGDIVSMEIGWKIPGLVRSAADAHPSPPSPIHPSASPPTDPGPAGAKKVPPGTEDLDLALLLDVPVELTVELGRTRITINELLNLRPGSAVKLAKLEGESVDILANDVLIARGEVVVRHEKYGIRITEITSRMERLKGLR